MLGQWQCFLNYRLAIDMTYGRQQLLGQKQVTIIVSIDHDSQINKYHTGVAQFQPTISHRRSVRSSILLQRLHSLLQQLLIVGEDMNKSLVCHFFDSRCSFNASLNPNALNLLCISYWAEKQAEENDKASRHSPFLWAISASPCDRHSASLLRYRSACCFNSLTSERCWVRSDPEMQRSSSVSCHTTTHVYISLPGKFFEKYQIYKN